MDEDSPHKSLYLFGRDVSQIPCFRNTFLYSISGGMVMGILTFLGTSRTRFACNVGFSSFFVGTFSYWSYCRYEWSKKKFENVQLKAAMRKQALYEGTEIEKELEIKGKLSEA